MARNQEVNMALVRAIERLLTRLAERDPGVAQARQAYREARSDTVNQLRNSLRALL